MIDWSVIDKHSYIVYEDTGEKVLDSRGMPVIEHVFYPKINFLSPRMVPDYGPDRDTYISTVGHALVPKKETGDTYFPDKGRDERAGSLPHGYKDLAEDKLERPPVRADTESAQRSQDEPARSPTSGTSETSMTTNPGAIDVRPFRATMPTFNQIRTSFISTETGGVRSAQVLAVNSLMDAFGRSPSDQALDLDPARFPLSLKCYMASAEFHALSIPTRVTRPNALRACAARFLELQAAPPRDLPSPDPIPFWAEVDRGLAKVTLNRKDSRVLSEYRAAGYMPKSPSDAACWERKLGMPEGLLQQHCWFWKPEQLFELRNNSYRWNGQRSGSTLLAYALKAFPPAVEQGFRHFSEWKNGVLGQPLRLEHLDGTIHLVKRTGRWTPGEGENAPEMPETERMTRETAGNVLSFLTLPVDEADKRMRGLSIPVEDLRLTHFFVAANLIAYCRFQADRNGPFDHNGLAQLLQYFRSLVGATDAFGRHAQVILFQDLSDVLGSERVPKTADAWNAWCEEQRLEFEDWVAQSTDGRQGDVRFNKARDVRVKMAHLLDCEAPIRDVVWPTILYLKENRPPDYYSTKIRYPFEARLFTLVAMTTEPLRDQNWREMAWKRHLDRRNGRWHINIPKGELKNRRLLSDPYRSIVEDDATPFFDDFYEMWKAHFGYDPLDPKEYRTAYVLAGFDGDGRRVPNGQVIKDRLKTLSTLWGFSIGAHAFRHIWATDWLKRFPDDFYTVAGKLSDSIGTIMQVYGKLRSRDHSQRVNRANAGRAALSEATLRDRQDQERDCRPKAA